MKFNISRLFLLIVSRFKLISLLQFLATMMLSRQFERTCLLSALSLSMSTNIGRPASSILRLERILANRGVGSRSEVGILIKQGRVRTVEGKVIRSASERYPDDTHFLVNGELSEEVSFCLLFSRLLSL